VNIEILHTADCPNSGPVVERVEQVAADRPEMTVIVTLIEQGRPSPDGFTGSPSVLIDGTNPFGEQQVDTAACALFPPTPDQVEAAIRQRPVTLRT